jgi:hypothetical protein
MRTFFPLVLLHDCRRDFVVIRECDQPHGWPRYQMKPLPETLVTGPEKIKDFHRILLPLFFVLLILLVFTCL